MTTTQSDLISNANESPQVMNEGALDGPFVRRKLGTKAVASGDLDTQGDTIELCDLPADAVVNRILLGTDALDDGTDLTMDLGLYEINDDGSLGSAADVDVYLDGGDDFQSAVSAWTEFGTGEARGVEDFGQKVYADADASEDEHEPEYRLALTVDTPPGTDVDGDVAFIVEYTVPA